MEIDISQEPFLLLLWNKTRFSVSIWIVANTPRRRSWLARGYTMRPIRVSAAGPSGPSQRSMWILTSRRAPTRVGTSLVESGLLGPRLISGHARQRMDEALLPDTSAFPYGSGRTAPLDSDCPRKDFAFIPTRPDAPLLAGSAEMSRDCRTCRFLFPTHSTRI